MASLTYTPPPFSGTVLFQTLFQVPPEFYENELKGAVKFTRFMPDLIVIEENEKKERIAVVIDAKASRYIKLEHRAQVTFYGIALRKIVEVTNTTYKTQVKISDVAGVWLNGKTAPSMFSLCDMIPALDRFIEHTLPTILTEENYTKGHSVQKWHFSERCVGCRWFDKCRTEASKKKTLSQIPHIEREQKEWLESFVGRKNEALAGNHSIAPAVGACEDIESLSKCLAQLKASEHVEGNDVGNPSTSLEERRNLSATLGVKFDACGLLDGGIPKLKALQEYNTNRSKADDRWKKQVFYPTGAYSLQIPNEEDWGVFIAMPKDLRSDCVYSYCICTRSGANAPGTDYSYNQWTKTYFEVIPRPSNMAPERNEGDERQSPEGAKQSQGPVNMVKKFETFMEASRGLMKKFVSDMVEIMDELTELNPESKPKTSFYVVDRNTAATIVSSLIDLLETYKREGSDPNQVGFENTLKCLYVLMHTADDIVWKHQPDMKTQALQDVLPRFSVVLEEIKKLVALPIPSFYTVKDVMKCLCNKPLDISPEAYEQALDSFGEQGIYESWALAHAFKARVSDDKYKRLKALLLRELSACNALLCALRAPGRGVAKFLPKEADTLKVDPPLQFEDIMYQKMRFFVDFEFLSRYREKLQSRTTSLPNQITQDKIAVLRFEAYADGSVDGKYLYENISGDVIFRCIAGIDSLDDCKFGACPYILVEGKDNNKLQQNIVKYSDLRMCNRAYNMHPGCNWPLCFCRVVKIDKENNLVTLNLTIMQKKKKNGKHQFQRASGINFRNHRNKLFSVHARFVDFNTQKLQNYISDEAKAFGCLQVSTYWYVMNSPLAWCERLRKNTAALQAFQGPINTHGGDCKTGLSMTSSQSDIFEAIRTHRLVIVWGPPGSGKTFFSGSTIVQLIRIFILANVPFRILVSAATHEAINNLLKKIRKLDDTVRVCKMQNSPQKKVYRPGDECVVKYSGDWAIGTVIEVDVESSRYKVRLLAGGRLVWIQADPKLIAPLVEIRRPNSMTKFLEDNPQCVIGATVWTLNRFKRNFLDKTAKKTYEFDMLFVDEASQLRVPEAALAINLLQKDKGRLVVVGDHFQLAPIVHEEYPKDLEAEITQPRVYESFLTYLKNRLATELAGQADPDGSYFKQLNENHRMSRPLAKMTEHTLGYSSYKICSNGGCKCRMNAAGVYARAERLKFEPPPPRSALDDKLNQYLNPKHAVTMVKLASSAPEPLTNEEGRSFEAELVARIVNRYRESSEDEGRVFCITPHHVQRKAILNGISERHLEGVTVNTVECMQGQEAALVIICYGFVDSSMVRAESSFLFSRNRLIVALTRAKSKVIFIVSDPIINPSFDIFENPNAEEGHSLLQGVYHLCCPKSGEQDYHIFEHLCGHETDSSGLSIAGTIESNSSGGGSTLVVQESVESQLIASSQGQSLKNDIISLSHCSYCASSDSDSDEESHEAYLKSPSIGGNSQGILTSSPGPQNVRYLSDGLCSMSVQGSDQPTSASVPSTLNVESPSVSLANGNDKIGGNVLSAATFAPSPSDRASAKAMQRNCPPLPLPPSLDRSLGEGCASFAVSSPVIPTTPSSLDRKVSAPASSEIIDAKPRAPSAGEGAGSSGNQPFESADYPSPKRKSSPDTVNPTGSGTRKSKKSKKFKKLYDQCGHMNGARK